MKLYRLFLEAVVLGIFLGIAYLFGYMKPPEQVKEVLGAYAVFRLAVWIFVEVHPPRRKDRRPPLEQTLDLPEYYTDRNGITRRRDPGRW